MKNPKISVIIPVYNAEKYLQKCLGSLLGQTLEEIEIICVNDGSTDDSLRILNEYASKDERIQVLSQANQGDGAARNYGMRRATGKYLSFLDADDFFDLDMLNQVYKRAEEVQAEVTVFNAWSFEDGSNVIHEPQGILVQQFAPTEAIIKREHFRNYIFNYFNSSVWNKLFLRSFILEHQLEFQSFRIVDNVYFVMIALALADTIAILDKRLLYYRTNNGSSQLANSHLSPLGVVEALLMIKNRLIAEGIYEELEQSFVNRAIEYCIDRLELMGRADAFEKLYDNLKMKSFGQLDIEGKDKDYFYNKEIYRKYCLITSSSATEYLFDKLMRVKRIGGRKLISHVLSEQEIPSNSNIILYGAGDVGRSYYIQILSSRRCHIVAWVDKNYEMFGYPVMGTDMVNKIDYDYILIAIENELVVKKIMEWLKAQGIPDDKILWVKPERL